MADFPRTEFENSMKDEMQRPVQINNSILNPLTKPMDFGKFLDTYNKGEAIEMDPIGERGTLVGYAEWYDKASNRTIILTVWANSTIDDTKPMVAQLCLDDKGRKVVFLRNRSENTRTFVKPVAAERKA